MYFILATVMEHASDGTKGAACGGAVVVTVFIAVFVVLNAFRDMFNGTGGERYDE